MKVRVAEMAVVAAVVAGAALWPALPAAADPPPPVVPADPAAPPPEAISYLDGVCSGPLAQSNETAPGIAGLPNLPALGNQLFLGQTSTPALPGTDPGGVPIPNALNNSYLLPQNLKPSSPGEGEIFGVDPGEENADITKREYLHRLYDSYRAGGLEGGLLGQRPASELDQPLPVEAPPPG